MRLILYQPEIARNAGASIRAAACFGAGVDIIEPCGFPADAKDLKRVAMDYGALAAPTRHPSWPAFVESAASRSGRLVLLSTKSDAPIWSFRFTKGDFVMVGRESAGVPPDVRDACDVTLVIPIAAGARSLNAAAAAAIALAEMRRQVGWT